MAEIETTKYDEQKIQARYMYWDGLAVYSKYGKYDVLAEAASRMLGHISNSKGDLKSLKDSLIMTANVFLEKLGPSGLLQVAQIAEHGAKKYGAKNYRLGTKWSRYVDATARHYLAYAGGEALDKDSKFNHLAHALANIFILLVYIEEGIGENDLGVYYGCRI